jgi:hypothetical protein
MQTLIHRACRRLSRQRGQVIIMFVGIFTVIAIVGAITVDFGLWFSERRGAQKDADLAALAGAQEYLDDPVGSWNTTEAFNAAREWAIQNGVDPARIDPAPTARCSPGNSCIQVGVGNCRENNTDTNMPWVEARIRHQSRSLFASIFGLLAPDIGGVARACVGSARSHEGNLPFTVQTNPEEDDFLDCFGASGQPLYGSVCVLRVGPGAGPSGQRGFLSLAQVGCGSGNSSDLVPNLTYGAPGTCHIGDEVTTDTGAKVGDVAKGLGDRLGFEIGQKPKDVLSVDQSGQCDRAFGNLDTYDDFIEVFSLPGDGPVVPSPHNVFVQNACQITVTLNSGKTRSLVPRSVTIIITDTLIQGEQHTTITGFAGFYIIGCVRDSHAAAAKATIEANLDNLRIDTLQAQLPGSFKPRCENITGQDVVLGVFVKEVTPSGDLGDPLDLAPLALTLVK